MRMLFGALLLAAIGCRTAPVPRPPPSSRPAPIQVPVASTSLVTTISSCEAPEIDRVSAAVADSLGRTESAAAMATVRALATKCPTELAKQDPAPLVQQAVAFEQALKVRGADAAYAKALAIALAKSPGAAIEYEVIGEKDKYHSVSMWWSPDSSALVQDGINEFYVWSALGDPRIIPGDPRRFLSPTEIVVWRTSSVDKGMDVWDVQRSSVLRAHPQQAEPWYLDEDRVTLHVGNVTVKVLELTQVVRSKDGAFFVMRDYRGGKAFDSKTGKLVKEFDDNMYGKLGFVGNSHSMIHMDRHILKKLDLDSGTETKLALVWGDLDLDDTTAVAANDGRIVIADLAAMKRVDQFTVPKDNKEPALGARYIATVNDDTTIELWQRDKPHAHVATLQLFETERGRDPDWIARLADGRFDASPTLRDRLQWKIGATTLPGAVAWKFLRTPGVALPLFTP